MKILLPVDGSDCALRAVAALLAQLPQWRDSPEVHLLHVHPPIPVGRVQAHVAPESLQRHYREESESEVQAACRQLDAAGVAYQLHIHVGPAATVIAKLADELACDLVVMGTHGRGAVGRLILGSVANEVVQLAPCPVQLVK